MRSLINDHQGFSILELVIVMSLVGGLSLVTMKLADEQLSNQAYIKANAEIQKSVSLLKNTLNDTENCRSILAGKSMGDSLASLQIPLKTSPGRFNEILSANTKYPGFETKGMRVQVPPGSPANIAQIEVDFLIKSKNMKLWGAFGGVGSNDRTLTERIPLVVSLAGTVISDCGPVVSDSKATAKKKFCDTLGTAAIWDEDQKKCIYQDMTCPYGQVLVKLTSFGGKVCGDIKDHINLEDLFDQAECTTTSGSYRIIDNGGKLKVECN